MAIQIVNGEARRFQYLLDSERLTEYDKDAFKSLLLSDMKESVLCSSLRILSELLEKHHGQKVILLIDEYDVPLAKAFEKGWNADNYQIWNCVLSKRLLCYIG